MPTIEAYLLKAPYGNVYNYARMSMGDPMTMLDIASKWKVPPEGLEELTRVYQTKYPELLKVPNQEDVCVIFSYAEPYGLDILEASTDFDRSWLIGASYAFAYVCKNLEEQVEIFNSVCKNESEKFMIPTTPLRHPETFDAYAKIGEKAKNGTYEQQGLYMIGKYEFGLLNQIKVFQKDNIVPIKKEGGKEL